MSLLDHQKRMETGVQQQTELTGREAPMPATLLESTWRDFIFAEVWTRPGLDRRARYFISISAAAMEGGREDILDNYIRGALTTGAINQTELREAALHLAVYGGWSSGTAVDAATTRVERELGLPAVDIEPVRNAPWDPDVRLQEGAQGFLDVMTMAGPPPVTAYFETGILNFVFGEMWMRPGLDQRSRRFVTMVGVANSASRIPIYSHTYAAMKSGNATLEEMHEFVLQYAIHGGWPKASVMQGAVFEMGKLVAEGKPFEA